MDLQQILNYRTNCLICQTPMTYADLGTTNTKLWNDDKGFHIRRHTAIRVDLNFDGTYCASAKSLKRCADLVFTKICRGCEGFPAITLKSRSQGITIINDFITKKKCCKYSFRFSPNQNVYNIELVGESIEYNDGNRFSCIDTFFTYNDSILTSGNYTANSINDIINNKVKIPTAINLSKVKTLDEYLNKYNLLMTFS